MQGLFLLTMKPVTYAANVAEGDLGDQVFTIPACITTCEKHWQTKQWGPTLMQGAVFATDTAAL